MAEEVQSFTAGKVRLLVEGLNAEEATRFYKAAFNAVEIGRSTAFSCDADVRLIGSVQLKVGPLTLVVADNCDVPNMPAIKPGVSFELETENVGAAVAKAVRAGAVQDGEVLECGGKASGKVMDPFGYIWILTTQGED